MPTDAGGFLLFVGAYFPANVFAVEWIAEHLAGRVGRRIVVVGSGMDRLAPLRSENLEIHGRVEDLSPYYARAEAVLLPIFSGAGMCTKTVEALCFGKALIASTHALRGLPLPLPKGIQICGNAEEWLAACSRPQLSWGVGGRLNHEYYRAHLSFESKVRRLDGMLRKLALADRSCI
jgi:hypothetical protein